MAIKLKSRREIEIMDKVGSVVARVLSKLKEYAKPGVSTGELDRVALEMTEQAGALALFKGVRSPYAKKAFPGAICASVNEEVVHGIPSINRVLNQGDILSVDFGVKLDGYCGDSAITFGIGEISALDQKLIDVTRQVLDIAVKMCRSGIKWSVIAGEMQRYCENEGFAVVRDYVGHGIGMDMHEDPKVPNFVSNELLKNDIVLREGMVLAVEPMINSGSCKVKTKADGWVVVTVDGKKSAHYEHTIAIINNGCKVLTLE